MMASSFPMLRSTVKSRPHLAAFACLAALCILAYANTFNHGFVFDDDRLVVKNHYVHNLEISKFFTTGYWEGYYAAALDRGDSPPADLGGVYRPLVLLTYSLNYLAGGLNPFGYHLFNLLLHLSVSFLIYLLAVQLGCSRWAALAGAGLFAVHPIHTEAVSAIYGRPELLMSLGVLGGLCCYIAALETADGSAGGRPGLKNGLVALSAGSFAVGLLSKEQALTLPALMVAYDLVRFRGAGIAPFLRSALPRYAPYLAILVLYFAARIAVLGVTIPTAAGIAFINNPLAHMSWDARLLTALKIAGSYLWLCLWPVRLSLDYSYNSIPVVSSLFDPGLLASLLAWLLLIGAGVWSLAAGARLVLIGTSITIITFFPASNFLVVIGTIMGERLFYLPSAGLALLAAGGWDRLQARASAGFRRRNVLSAGLVIALLLLTVRTVARNRDWRSDEALFRSAVAVVPENAKIQHNLGLLEKDPEKALEYLAKAREIYPDYVKNNPQVAFQEGLVLLRTDRLEEAVEMFELAARRRPKLEGLLFNLGFSYMKLGRWEQAEAAYRKAIALNLWDVRIHNDLSFVLWKQERYAEALEAAELAAKVDASYAEAHYNRGAALEAMGRLDQAATAYEQAFKLKPSSSVKRRLESVRERAGANGRPPQS